MNENVFRNYPIKNLIYPLFVREGKGVREPVPSMQGIMRFSPDTLVEEVKQLKRLGIEQVLIFGVPRKKDDACAGALGEDSVVSRSVQLIKKEAPGVIVMTDICLCAYTQHGHCGIIRKGARKLDNGKTVRTLALMALAHAQAGADYVAPSAMADGQVAAIRSTLDAHGFRGVSVMAYSAKFASLFYGPFRRAADCAPQFGDRSGYQLGIADREKALLKIREDIEAKADIVMVKPALGYLDIVVAAKKRYGYPLAAYNVSGEYAMVKAGSKLGYWDEKKMVLEILSSIHRAGADLIITYHAKDIAKWARK